MLFRSTNGVCFQSVDRVEREIYQGMAYHLAGNLSVDIALLKDRSLKLGAEVGYNLYLSTFSLTNFTSGLFLSWTF